MARLTVPTGTTVDFDVPLEGRATPITVSCPLIKWMPPKHVKAYNSWATKMIELEKKYTDWLLEDEKARGDAPCKPEDIDINERDFKLRWLKPYVSASTFRALDDGLPIAAVDWIFDRLNGKDLDVVEADDSEISAGESGASATS